MQAEIFHTYLKTTNSGRSWVRQNFNSHTPLDLFCFNDTTVWLCGQPGLIFYTIHGGQTSVYQISENVPDNFKLYQNFPNPFNPSTTIKFSIKNKGSYNLEIYNSLGKQVADLISKELTTGEYEYRFDAFNLTSGIYFYKLYNEKFSLTEKMILMK